MRMMKLPVACLIPCMYAVPVSQHQTADISSPQSKVKSNTGGHAGWL